MSWQSQKREAKRRAWAEQAEQEDAERARVAALSMYDRIEEAETTYDLKAILHLIVERLEL